VALQLNNPNASTRVSGINRKPLSEWAKARNRRLPDRGGLLPLKGVKRYLANGDTGGTPNRPLSVNLAVTLQPILKIPAALAARAEALRRQARRFRLSQEATPVLLGGALTYSGKEFAQAPRMRDTPSGYRGALRDRRHPGSSGPGVQYYEQEVAPFSAVKRLTASRVLAEPRAHSSFAPGPAVDYRAGVDANLGMRAALGSASGSAVGKIVPAEMPNSGSGPLAMILVGLAFFFVFWRR
jgi:hypothetical protein